MPLIALLLFGALILSNSLSAGEIHNVCMRPTAENLEKAKALIAANPAVVNEKGAGGNTPLMWVAFRGNKDFMLLLITNKADVNARDQYDSTALHSAALTNNKEAVQALLDAGAKVDATDSVTRTPLLYSVVSKNTTNRLEVMKLLLDKGANPNAGVPESVTKVAKSLKDPAPYELLKRHGGR